MSPGAPEITGWRPFESLAAYVTALQIGSACFCCGELLRPLEAGPGVTTGPEEAPGAACPSCGSSVAEVRRDSAAEERAEIHLVGVPAARSLPSLTQPLHAPAARRKTVGVASGPGVRLFV